MREMPRAGERATHRRTDPAYAPNVEVFDNLTHTEIHAKVQLLDPAVLSGGTQAWSDAAAHLADAVFQAHTEIRAAIADGWRGSAAKSADAVVRVFEQSGQDLADVFAVVSQRLGQASDAAEALRAAVTEPPAAAPDLAGALLDPSRATSNVEGQKASEHARQDVVRAMNDIYAGVFVQTGTDVPAYPDEADRPTATAPTPAPASKLVGTVQPSPDAQPISLGTHTQEPNGAAERSAGTAPADQAPAAETPTTSAAAAAPAAPVTAETPATTVPKVPSAATAALPTVAAAASLLRTAPAAAASGPTTASASATSEPMTTPAVPGLGSQVPPEEQRKRDERRKNNDSGDAAVTGLSAGAMGGLMGGAVAAVDTPRTGSSVAANAVSARSAPLDDEDDEFDLDDLPTFLEPSDDGGELIGSLDPTTPPVLGEWSEYE
ncbi:WXG100 family type VII secretion target [Nocardia gamkensis]|uniref:WXG100 family type VII secretion target n=1 Tax=Nocardia gamkensis TaxID=352869 RepID=UPI0036E78853